MSRQQVVIPGDGLQEQFTSHSVPVTTWASDINPIIASRSLRPGQPYLSPAHTMNYQAGKYGIPYVMQGIAVQTCNVLTITAPEPYLASWITHPTGPYANAGPAPFGSAPTAGIYTGSPVEETC